MSTTTAPVSVSGGQAAQLVQPGGGQSQYGAVVINNLSQFQLTGQVGADTVYVPPFTAQVFLLGLSQSAPINLNPSLPSGSVQVLGVAEQVTATWYLAGEKIPGTYPISLAAQALDIGITGAITTQTVFIEKLLFQGTLAIGSPITVNDVDKYGSLIVTAGNVGDMDLVFFFTSPLVGATAGSGHMEKPPTQGTAEYQIPVTGQAATFDLQVGADVTLTVAGTNRLAERAIEIQDGNYIQNPIILTGLLVAGTDYSMGPVVPPASGWASWVLQVSGNTVKGYWVLREGSGNTFVVADSAELVLQSTGAYQAKRVLAMSPGFKDLTFHCTIGGTDTVSAELMG